MIHFQDAGADGQTDGWKDEQNLFQGTIQATSPSYLSKTIS